MWRDRTNLYISYRQSYAHHPAKKRSVVGASANGFSTQGSESEERRGLMSAGAFEDDGDAIIEMDLLPPRWTDVQDEVTELLEQIAKKSASLEKLHQKHVLPSFDDEDVRKREEATIERMTSEITRGFHDCQKAIQKVEMMVREAKRQGRVTRADETMARNIQVALAATVQEASAGFRKKQSNYMKKLRQLGGMSSPFNGSSSPSQNPYTDPSMMESESDKSFSQSTLQQTTLQQTTQKRLSSNDAAIAQREREINEIAKGIIELADIFKDLQMMIIDQGTMLDRIDYNIENMVVNVKEAEKELVVATGYQRKSMKRKILLFLLLLVIGMFILLLVKPKRSKALPDISHDLTNIDQTTIDKPLQIPTISITIVQAIQVDSLLGTKWLIRDKANMANMKKYLIDTIKLKNQEIKTLKAKLRMAKMTDGFLRRIAFGRDLAAASRSAPVIATTVATLPPGGVSVAARDWTVGRTASDEEAGNDSGEEEDLAEVNVGLRDELTILQAKIEKLRVANCEHCLVTLSNNLENVGL